MSALNPIALMALQDSNGLPLNNGYIYFGAVNADPQTNPIVVYWDAALTQIAKQPLRTIFGRVYNNGTPAKVFANGNYSVQVLDSQRVSILYDLNVAQPVDNPVPINQGGTGATTAAGALANLGVIAAFVQQIYGAFTTAGTGLAYTLTPVPAIAASPANTRFNITFHTAGGAAPTLTISGLTPKNLKQYNSVGVKIAAVIAANQISDVVDDGTDYLLLDPFPSASSGGGTIGSPQIRNTFQFGVRDANGVASFLGAGAGLNFNISTSTAAIPLEITFAAGFGATGQVDQQTVISADAANQGALGFSNTNYIFANYVNSIAVTWGNTKAPPQVGDTYKRNNASLVQFGGAAGSTSFPDDFGNTYTAQGTAKVQTNNFAFGTGGLGGGGASNALDGATDSITSTDFISFGSKGWALRCFVTPSALPGAGSTTAFASAHTASLFASACIGVYNNGGVIRYCVSLSSTAASNDIALLQQGTTVLPVIGRRDYLELTYDALGGNYRLYVNGAQDRAIASALKVAAFTTVTYGKGAQGGAITFFNGYMDKCEIVPYCDHPGGTSYLTPTAASIATAGYAQDWYDIGAGVTRSPSVASAVAGTNPTFVAVNRVYAGEQDTNGTNVTATRTYAYNGRFDRTLATTAVGTTLQHNIGAVPAWSQLLENGITQYKALTLDTLAVTWTAALATSRIILNRGY